MNLFNGAANFVAKRLFLLKILVGRFVFGPSAFHDSQDFQVFFSFAIGLFSRALGFAFGAGTVFPECDFLEGFVIPAVIGYIKRFEHVMFGTLTQIDG